MDQIGVGIIGSGFIASVHVEAFSRVPEAQIVAMASPTPGRAEQFARQYHIRHFYEDYRALLERPDIQLVTLALPNFLHCQATLDAAAAGKHVVCEKPMALNLDECDQMIAACRSAGVKLMYAEELLFAPKYVRAKQLADEGALGRVYLVKQNESHYGPHSDWFWNADLSGGGVLMDMGCHSIEFARAVFGRARPTSVYAQLGTYVHQDKTRGEDHSVCIVEYEGNRFGIAENSWAKTGGVDDRAEIFGSAGLTYADLLRGSSLVTFSEPGYGYAVEKAPDTRGWTFTMFEESWNYGFPQEMSHFTQCVKDNLTPIETG
ncbi:MAG TPA: Gfo/Idh/MocA family oxidoreductase, partial [Chloroflexota bacterium]|nr:Gfo/Idh/MocA family oxidoreductase [Chloroflexota bacterium]